MTVTHIVLFQFKADASAEAIKQAWSSVLGLKDACVHPTSKQPYILSLTGGTNITSDKLNNGITHAFVFEFATAEDRDYYVKQDPVHVALVSGLLPIVEKINVVAYTPGVFESKN